MNLLSLLFINFLQLWILVIEAYPLTQDNIIHERCGSRDFNSKKDKYHERLLGELLGSGPIEKLPSNITIPVIFHVMYTDKKMGKLTEKEVKQQIQVLNDDYGPAQVKFELKRINYVNEGNWFFLAYSSPAERLMKDKLREGDATTLNVYTGLIGGGLLGWSSFPQDYDSQPFMDGVVLHYQTLPDGMMSPYDQGRTLTHEVGHWLGLWHTFQDGCSFPNDFVDDTRAEKEATLGCFLNKPKRVTCKKKDFQNEEYQTYELMNAQYPYDAVQNFMNYVEDKCMNNFTPGQIARIYAQWTFREGNR